MLARSFLPTVQRSCHFAGCVSKFRWRCAQCTYVNFMKRRYGYRWTWTKEIIAWLSQTGNIAHSLGDTFGDYTRNFQMNCGYCAIYCTRREKKKKRFAHMRTCAERKRLMDSCFRLHTSSIGLMHRSALNSLCNNSNSSFSVIIVFQRFRTYASGCVDSTQIVW